MNSILGYYEDAEHQPVAAMTKEGLIVFNKDSKLKRRPLLGGLKELKAILGNVEYIQLFQKSTLKTKVAQQTHSRKTHGVQKGGQGFFGESVGRCGWGNSPSCCFYDCAPLWKTQAWPWKFYL